MLLDTGCIGRSIPWGAIMVIHEIIRKWKQAPRADKAALGAINDSVGKFKKWGKIQQSRPFSLLGGE
jgi:hypothetical protein